MRWFKYALCCCVSFFSAAWGMDEERISKASYEQLSGVLSKEFPGSAAENEIFLKIFCDFPARATLPTTLCSIFANKDWGAETTIYPVSFCRIKSAGNIYVLARLCKDRLGVVTTVVKDEFWQKRLQQLTEFVDFALELESDHYAPKIAERIIQYRIEMRASGFVDAIPAEWGLAQDVLWPKAGDWDAQVAAWTRIMAQLEAFMADRGGSLGQILYAFSNYTTYYDCGPWLQSELAAYRKPRFPYFFPESQGGIRPVRGCADWHASMLMMIAFNVEVLRKIDFPGGDPESQRLYVYRGLRKSRIKEIRAHGADISVGWKGYFSMPPMVSTSAFGMVIDFSKEGLGLVFQVPYHRVIFNQLILHVSKVLYEFEIAIMGDEVPVEAVNPEDYICLVNRLRENAFLTKQEYDTFKVRFANCCFLDAAVSNCQSHPMCYRNYKNDMFSGMKEMEDGCEALKKEKGLLRTLPENVFLQRGEAEYKKLQADEGEKTSIMKMGDRVLDGVAGWFRYFQSIL